MLDIITSYNKKILLNKFRIGVNYLVCILLLINFLLITKSRVKDLSDWDQSYQKKLLFEGNGKKNPAVIYYTLKEENKK